LQLFYLATACFGKQQQGFPVTIMTQRCFFDTGDFVYCHGGADDMEPLHGWEIVSGVVFG
jgi:hypothetical protein